MRGSLSTLEKVKSSFEGKPLQIFLEELKMAQVKYGNILSLLMLSTFIFIGSMSALGIFSQQDAAVNVTGTAYEDTYNSNQKLQEVFVAILPLAGFIVAAIALLLIVGVVRKH